MNTLGTTVRRDVFSALLPPPLGSERTGHRPVAAFDLAISHQTLAEGPKPALLWGSAKLAWR
ncbi:hypothetical protein [Serratia fonticola]